MRHGKAKILTREEINSMAPNRPATGLASDIEQQTKDSYQQQSWAEQGETIRRLNGRVLAHVAGLVDSGNIDDSVLSQLARCSQIAKSWAPKEDDADLKQPLSRAELERIANK